MAGKNVICLAEYKKSRREMDPLLADLCYEENITRDSGDHRKRKEFVEKLHNSPKVLALRRREWETGAREVLRTPVTLKQFYLRMLLKGVEEPDINLWWLYEWEKDGKVVELDNGLFQLAEYSDQKKK